jgi:ribosome-associated protein
MAWKWIPLIFHELEIESTRSRGAGGQHVNRTNSAALLRWKVKDSQAITEEQKQTLLRQWQKDLVGDGEILLRSEEFRESQLNRKKCLEKLESRIERAFFIPPVRKKTKPTKSSQRKRQQNKKRRGEIKKARGKILNWDES